MPRKLGRITRLAAAGAFVLLAAGAVTASRSAAETLDQVKAAAAKEGKVVWYDSLPRAQGDAILAEFQKAYPFIKTVEYLEVPGAAKTAKITQESRAGGPTADVTLDGPASGMRHQASGFLLSVDWKALGVTTSKERTPNQYLVAITTPLFGVLYNTNKVKPADVPKTYADLLDKKWEGRVGTWARAIGFVILAADWGEDKTADFVKKFSALKPKLFRSTYAAAQSVGAGEVDLIFAIHHTALPTIEKGAPVKWLFLEPVPVGPLYGVLLKYGKNPNAGKLLLAWLGSKEGALAYEKVAKRGNPFIPETETSKMLAGRKISMFDAETEVAKA
ncbi:MAG: extracellular solute-binding protein, partial [Rhodospirillaceae bacterium]|nr:extracellular solute-binding protein [Rhodospirillaceae bacterium]